MQPTMNMDTSAKTLDTQSSLKASEVEELIYYDYQHNKKLWSTSPSALFTTSLGESLIVTTNSQSRLYSCRRIGDAMFEIDFVGDMDNSIEKFDDQFDDILEAPIPLFSRTHIVSIENDGVMLCTCCSFESGGIYCKHLKKVADTVYAEIGLEFNRFTHHDVALPYNAAYMHLAYKTTTPKHLNALFHHLAKHETFGPRLQVSIPSSITIQSSSEALQAIDQLKNYKKDYIDFGDQYFESMHRQTFKCAVDNDHVVHELENLFETSIDDYDFPISQSVDSRHSLKGLVDEAYSAADDVGHEGIVKMQLMLREFKTWCNEKRNDSKNNNHTDDDRTYVPMTQDSYVGMKKRILNTYHMP